MRALGGRTELKDLLEGRVGVGMQTPRRKFPGWAIYPEMERNGGRTSSKSPTKSESRGGHLGRNWDVSKRSEKIRK